MNSLQVKLANFALGTYRTNGAHREALLTLRRAVRSASVGVCFAAGRSWRLSNQFATECARFDSE